MIMDSWKRLYSNTPAAKFNEICLNGLWNGADIPNSPTNEVGPPPPSLDNVQWHLLPTSLDVIEPSANMSAALPAICCPYGWKGLILPFWTGLFWQHIRLNDHFISRDLTATAFTYLRPWLCQIIKSWLWLLLQHFEGYDAEGYSLWFLDYKYPEENTVNFIVMNKVGSSIFFLLSQLESSWKVDLLETSHLCLARVS